jgi:hypothetical protein
MAAVEPDASGPVDYRVFVERLLEGGHAHPRLAHSAPPGGKGGKGEAGLAASSAREGGGGGALARFGQTLTVPVGNRRRGHVHGNPDLDLDLDLWVGIWIEEG